MTRKAAPLLLALAALQITCNQVILTAPAGSTLNVFANPEFIPANGGVSVISALVIEPAGTPVADGTVVQFFTNLGRIEEQGKTNDGVARVNFVSDARSGKATITAFIGGAGAPAPSPSASPGTGGGTTGGSTSDTVEVTIGSALPDHVLVTADPTRIRSNDPRQSRIVANVFDASGNPVQNIPVIFTVAQDGATEPTEMMVSAGAPVFTDSNGQAIDILGTRYPRDSPAKTVTVTATTANGKTADVVVQLN